ncbi:MAG: HAD family hydrolase [Conexivisphaerales archaeon]
MKEGRSRQKAEEKVSGKRISYLSLDFEGTLVNSGYPEWYWKELIPYLYSKKKGVPLQESKNLILHDYETVGPDKAEWYTPIFWFKRYQMEDEYETSIQALKSRIKPFPDIKRLKLPYGIKLIICSGAWTDIIRAVLEEQNIGVYGIFVPSSFNMTKKNPDFYRHVCQILNETDPSVFLHIGDDVQYDYFSPREAGWNSILLDREGKIDQKGIKKIKSLSELNQFFAV